MAQEMSRSDRWVGISEEQVEIAMEGGQVATSISGFVGCIC